MSQERKQLGQKGEQQAALFLKQQGYKIIKQNLSFKFGEIDILAQDKDGTIVIVEVKTKVTDKISQPHESVTVAKQRKLLMLARIIEEQYLNSPIRIDVVSIKEGEIEHIKNAIWRK